MQNAKRVYQKPQKIACTLAAQIYKTLNKTITWADAMQKAWDRVKADPTLRVINGFKKSTQEWTKRVVAFKITNYYEPMSFRPTKGLTKFIDICKQVAHPILGSAKSIFCSFYEWAFA